MIEAAPAFPEDVAITIDTQTAIQIDANPPDAAIISQTVFSSPELTVMSTISRPPTDTVDVNSLSKESASHPTDFSFFGLPGCNGCPGGGACCTFDQNGNSSGPEKVGPKTPVGQQMKAFDGISGETSDSIKAQIIKRLERMEPGTRPKRLSIPLPDGSIFSGGVKPDGTVYGEKFSRSEPIVSQTPVTKTENAVTIITKQESPNNGHLKPELSRPADSPAHTYADYKITTTPSETPTVSAPEEHTSVNLPADIPVKHASYEYGEIIQPLPPGEIKKNDGDDITVAVKPETSKEKQLPEPEMTSFDLWLALPNISILADNILHPEHADRVDEEVTIFSQTEKAVGIHAQSETGLVSWIHGALEQTEYPQTGKTTVLYNDLHMEVDEEFQQITIKKAAESQISLHTAEEIMQAVEIMDKVTETPFFREKPPVIKLAASPELFYFAEISLAFEEEKTGLEMDKKDGAVVLIKNGEREIALPLSFLKEIVPTDKKETKQKAVKEIIGRVEKHIYQERKKYRNKRKIIAEKAKRRMKALRQPSGRKADIKSILEEAHTEVELLTLSILIKESQQFYIVSMIAAQTKTNPEYLTKKTMPVLSFSVPDPKINQFTGFLILIMISLVCKESPR